MLLPGITSFAVSLLFCSLSTTANAASSALPLNISVSLFTHLEELARIVDISYCVGTTGIFKPFLCASRCTDFPSFELVTTFNTGPLMSDSCGYIALDHGVERAGRKNGGNGKGRILVVFRGTYSIANTIVDLSTIPQEYVPYPDDPDDGADPPPSGDENSQHRRKHSFFDWLPPWRRRRPSWFFLTPSSTAREASRPPRRTCTNCTVHYGFWTSWQNTRDLIIPHVKTLRTNHPEYEIHLVGHSLGGAVALLAGLEFQGRGWEPTVTTFGEPRVGNRGLREWVDWSFGLSGDENDGNGEDRRYRRVTHVDDPVPLLPLHEWGYRSHAGEVYISKPSLQPSPSDIHLCYGDNDASCIAGAESDAERSYQNAIAASPKSQPSSHPSLSSSSSPFLTPQHPTTTPISLQQNQAQLDALPAQNKLLLQEKREGQDAQVMVWTLRTLLDSPHSDRESLIEQLWRQVIQDDEAGRDEMVLDTLLDFVVKSNHFRLHNELPREPPLSQSSITIKQETQAPRDPTETAQARAKYLLDLNVRWGIPIPARYKIWQLFFAHRDYFWRLGLCVPGGDPWGWGGGRYEFGEKDGEVKKDGREGKERKEESTEVSEEL